MISASACVAVLVMPGADTFSVIGDSFVSG
jgi:hypothetical protein